MTEQLDYTDWTWEQVRRWRRPNGERPRTYAEMITMGVLLGVIVIGELKDHHYALVGLARELVDEARAHDHPAWYMVLDNMEPRGKVAAVRQAGGRIALIFGRDGVTKPDDWARWPFYPDQIWGPDFARRWLPA